MEMEDYHEILAAVVYRKVDSAPLTRQESQNLLDIGADLGYDLERDWAGDGWVVRLRRQV